jgi:signal transduction histidine kinase
MAIGIATLATALAIALVCHMKMSVRHIENTQKLWVEHNSKSALLALNVNRVFQGLGYGGFIHNFKNLVLRRDPLYIPMVERNISETAAAFKDIERMELTGEDGAAIRILRGTFEEYVQKFKIARRMLATGTSSKEIDAVVRVDDSAALKARIYLAESALTRSRQMEKKTGGSLDETFRFMSLGLLTIPFILLFCVALIFFLYKLVSAYEEIMEARKRAEEATRLKYRFVSIVAHDLRSPFGTIIGFLRILCDDRNNPLTPAQYKLVDMTLNASTGLLEMIDELLDMNRLQSGKIIVDAIPIKAHPFVGQVILEMERLAHGKGVTIENRLDTDAELRADRRLLHEVFRNLLSNAIKFSHPEGRIEVFSPPGERGAVAVMDHGIGMDPGVIPDLFRHEVKTSTVGTAGERGTGLGLPFCHDVITAHGGSLSVESKPGGGARFTVRLPQ